MIPKPDPIIHLYRGAPPVRAWTKHQETIEGWTLCGIRRKGHGAAPGCVEDPRKVSCRHCLDLNTPHPRPAQVVATPSIEHRNSRCSSGSRPLTGPEAHSFYMIENKGKPMKPNTPNPLRWNQ